MNFALGGKLKFVRHRKDVFIRNDLNYFGVLNIGRSGIAVKEGRKHVVGQFGQNS